MPEFDKSMGFKMKGSSFYGHGNQSPVKNRAADPLAKEGEETTRTSTNLVTGGTNTVAKYTDSPAKKPLIGDQDQLPEELKAKIEAAPGKMYDSPAKRTTKDALTANIRNTNQKGDNAKPDPKSKKIGPAESPAAINKKYEAHFAAKDKISASAKKGDDFSVYAGEGPANKKTGRIKKEAETYVKR